MSGIKLSGVGCSLMDFLYANIDFRSEVFKKYISRKSGDGGLTPGHLVFLDDLEKFSGSNAQAIIDELTGGKAPDKHNIGGPAIVALINAAQMLYGKDVKIDFHGAAGKDWIAEKLFEILEKTPLKTDNYKKLEGATPSTFVLSDPDYNEGKGERTFINNIGAAWKLKPEDLSTDFFDADIALFGATALMPEIHDGLTELLAKGKQSGCVNIVITVYDFRNEAANPDKKWPLGKSDESFKNIDLLIVDQVEALRISGEDTVEKACEFYKKKGVSSFIVTHGAKSITAYSDGRLFKKQDVTSLPVSSKVVEILEKHPEKKGDTTGCGDNFAGGVIGSVASQMLNAKPGSLDITEAISWGVASGGFACFYIGGTYIEKAPGEKLEQLKYYYSEYSKQLGRA